MASKPQAEGYADAQLPRDPAFVLPANTIYWYE